MAGYVARESANFLEVFLVKNTYSVVATSSWKITMGLQCAITL